MKFIINEIITGFIKDKVSTRKRDEIPNFLKEIAQKLKPHTPKENNPLQGDELLFLSTNNSTPGTGHNTSTPTEGVTSLRIEDSRPKATPSLNINNQKAFCNYFKELIRKYGKKIEKEFSYKIIQELTNVNCEKLPRATIGLLRSLIDSLAYEDRDRTKHKDIVKPFLNDLKASYPNLKKLVEDFLKEYDILSSVVHGQSVADAQKCFSVVSQYYKLLEEILKSR